MDLKLQRSTLSATCRFGCSNTREVPDVYASNFTAMRLPGEGGPDFSNKLGTLPDPPVLPIVSQ
jgi:hypothetical protein